MSQQKRRLTLEELKARGYRPGSIVRVKMVNFITYDDAEVFPGPRLNVVLGPNGTGKSTLTHAICLACAGSTGTVGRSGELKQFVKKGKEGEPEKYVEVDMMKSNDIVTIRRDLSGDDNSSHWYLNSKPVSKKVIKDLMVQMSVDVDNLCSFMAQDKVGNFTLQSPKEMLQTTLKSIRDRDESKTLYEIQMELASKEQMKLARQRDLDAKVQQVHMLTQEIEGLRPEVERIHRRNDLKRLIELYNIKRVVLTNREGREHVRLKQLACDEASKALATEQEKFQPMRNRERELERQKAIEDKTIDQSRKARKTTEDAVRVLREALDDADLATNAAELELSRYSDKRRNVEQSLSNLRKEAQDHQKHYDKLMAA
jgi:structural maintenance of chromosomes protein 5